MSSSETCKEMNAYTQLYESVYGSAKRVEEITRSLNHFEGGAPYDKWMVIPDIIFSCHRLNRVKMSF